MSHNIVTARLAPQPKLTCHSALKGQDRIAGGNAPGNAPGIHRASFSTLKGSKKSATRSIGCDPFRVEKQWRAPNRGRCPGVAPGYVLHPLRGCWPSEPLASLGHFIMRDSVSERYASSSTGLVSQQPLMALARMPEQPASSPQRHSAQFRQPPWPGDGLPGFE